MDTLDLIPESQHLTKLGHVKLAQENTCTHDKNICLLYTSDAADE